MTADPTRSRRRLAGWAGGGILAALACWIYFPAIGGGWLWDDYLEIRGNPAVRAAGGWWRAWVSPRGMDYLPLKDAALWLQWRLWSGRVEGFHLANVALHVAASLLIWHILRRLGVRPVAAWFGGLLFAVHPAAVGSVAWMAEFKNTLSLPLLLGAFAAFMTWADRPGGGGPPVAAGALFVASLLAKSSGVMFPVLCLLYLGWKRAGVGWKDVRTLLPFFAASAVCGVVTIGFQMHRAIGLGGPIASLGSRLSQAGWSVAADIGEAFAIVRPAPIYAPVSSAVSVLLPLAALAAIVAYCWRHRSTWGRHVLLGLGWFLVNLVPVLGVIPMAYLRVAPRADQFLYLPLVGLVGLVAAGVGAMAAGDARRQAALAALGAVLVGSLAADARAYAALFRSPEALWTYALQRNPQAWLARNNLGEVLLDEGRPLAAEPILQEAVRERPDSAETRANWANSLVAEGRPAEAEAQFRTAIASDPKFAGAAYDLGVLLLREGRFEEAAGEFRATLAINPGYATAHNNLGLALAHLGRWGEADREYRAALALAPGLAEAWLNWGNAAMTTGDWSAAAARYRRALALEPNATAIRRALADALERAGDYAGARAQLEAAESAPPAR